MSALTVSMSPIRVLYAEDYGPDADLTRTHLELQPRAFTVDVVDTGERCLARLREASYDVVLLDRHLPDMDGTDVLKELFAQGVRLPVVIVTAAGDEALVVQLLRLGAWDYVAKTGNYLDTLPDILRNAVAEYQRRQDLWHPVDARSPRILYAENHDADIDLTLAHFAEAAAHLSVSVVRSSAEALARLRRESFDLVLADLRMPDMSGLELLRECMHRGVRVPFIVVTGRGDEATALAALKLGADDYIVKRENYVAQLPHAIDHAIARAELGRVNARLQTELAQRTRAEAEKSYLLGELVDQRRRVDEIIASVPGVVWESRGRPGDPDHTMRFVSDHAQRMLGYPLQAWLSTANFWLSIVHPDDRARAAHEAAEGFAGGRGGVSQFRWIAQDGRIVWVESHATALVDEAGRPVGMRGVTMDITARKEAEGERAQLAEQFQHAQKMESIGRLAAGVAHDFNNVLTAIIGGVQLVALEHDPDDPVLERLREIERAGERGAALTHQLLAFSRKQVLRPRVLALNAVMEESTKMLRRLLGEDIRLVTVLDPELGRVKVDPGQIDQIVLNLAVNARDAMPQGGQLVLETRNVVLDDERLQRELALPPGPYVMLTVRDTGVGMDATTLSRIFEPFFTTKEHGKGTGLGLSTVYGIVKQSGGSISVESAPAHGTRLTVYLPRVDAPLDAEDLDADTAPVEPSRTLLVVEDEDMVRTVACDALRRFGYQVLEAADGAEALEVCEQHPGPIALMLTDVVIPQMSGRELATRARRLRPDLRVVYMSGYTHDVIDPGSLGPGTFFLQKPFTLSALARKVHEVLRQPIAPPVA
jgi:PAS domain S-box-containing protein